MAVVVKWNYRRGVGRQADRISRYRLDTTLFIVDRSKKILMSSPSPPHYIIFSALHVCRVVNVHSLRLHFVPWITNTSEYSKPLSMTSVWSRSRFKCVGFLVFFYMTLASMPHLKSAKAFRFFNIEGKMRAVSSHVVPEVDSINVKLMEWSEIFSTPTRSLGWSVVWA